MSSASSLPDSAVGSPVMVPDAGTPQQNPETNSGLSSAVSLRERIQQGRRELREQQPQQDNDAIVDTKAPEPPLKQPVPLRRAMGSSIKLSSSEARESPSRSSRYGPETPLPAPADVDAEVRDENPESKPAPYDNRALQRHVHLLRSGLWKKKKSEQEE